jgi:hypothetical protein
MYLCLLDDAETQTGNSSPDSYPDGFRPEICPCRCPIEEGSDWQYLSMQAPSWVQTANLSMQIPG